MHLKRWITGIVTLPFLVLLICKGGSFLFAVFISIVCILALWEYFRIVFNGVQGSRFKVQGSNAKAESSKLEVQGSKLKAQSSKQEVESSKIRAESSKLKAQSSKQEAESSKIRAGSSKLKAQSSKVRIIQLSAFSFELSASCFQLSAFIIGPMIIWAAYKNSFDIVIGLITLNLVISGLISLRQFKHDSSAPEIVAKQVLSIIYIPLFLSYLVLIRGGIDDGITWIFFLLCIVFAGDIGAYYVGSYFGRHKLCPAVSPGKTIEGSVGGLAANLAAGALFKSFFLPLFPWGLSILFFLLIGVAGQVGDLFESELKRAANIKDSGVILPGHGGVLDRIDALLFAAPVAFLFKEYILC